MKKRLEAIFAEVDEETVILVLDELGYVPALEQGAVILSSDAAASLASVFGYNTEQLARPSEKIIEAIQEERSAKIQAAKSEAKKEILAYVRSIFDVCALGGKMEMAAALIAKEATVEDAREKILAKKAMQLKGANPLLEDAKKRGDLRLVS